MSIQVEHTINKELIVIGAGMAGLNLAIEMQNYGWDVAVLEKARGSGGRLASKRVASDGGERWSGTPEVSFDLGCSHFSAVTPEFKDRLQLWIAQGVVEQSAFTQGKKLYTGTPRSSSLTRRLANNVEAHFSTRVTKVTKVNKRWQCYETLASGELKLIAIADFLVMAIPPEQIAQLLPDDNTNQGLLSSVTMQAKWVAMLLLDEHVDLNLALNNHDNDAVLSIIDEAKKPGRKAPEGYRTWVVQMSAEWSELHINEDKNTVYARMLELLECRLGESLNVKASHIHRWLYAQAASSFKALDGVLELNENLYACGDWVERHDRYQVEHIDGVERAFLSAQYLSTRLLSMLPGVNKMANISVNESCVFRETKSQHSDTPLA